MRRRTALASGIVAILIGLLPIGASAYANFDEIGNFNGGNGADPAGITLSEDGFLYGVAAFGPDPSNDGIIYRLNRSKETIEILYEFSGASGYFPTGKVAIDAHGLVYGVNTASAHGAGTAFVFNPRKRKLKVLHRFLLKEGKPTGGLVFGKDGNLYGTTQAVGSTSGTVYKLSPATGALTNLQTLDRYYVYDPLVVAPDGNIFGSTYFTGTSDYGLVFEIAAATGAYSVVYNFQPADGAESTKLAVDPSGNLFVGRMLSNTTGSILRFTAPSYQKSVFASFGPSNGDYPVGAMTFLPNGYVIGATSGGGISGGTMFGADAQTGAVQTLYQFNTGFDAYQGYPVTDLITTKLGIFGTTSQGGAYDQGTIFQFFLGR
jgi:uncharacterized repeat protein (TIGR03803 family)